ncbi:MAG: hypothetical protein IJ365_05920, partial [Clostridia bacterium]|nr:hypothetical protein [Clostridia bacterium]
MIKKLIALLLTLFMLMMSLGCSAQNSDAWKENAGTIDLDAMTVTGEGISVDGTTVKIVAGGDFEVKGTLPDG